MNFIRKITPVVVLGSNLTICCLQATPLLFCHGFGGDSRQATYYSASHCADLISFNFPEVGDKKLFNAGQEADIKTLDDNYMLNFRDTQKAQAPIIVGVSRGAAVIINWISQHIRQVSALVLESPYARIQDIVEYKINRIPLVRWLPFGSKIVHHFFFKKFIAPQYNPKGPHPIDAIDIVPRNIPIFMYASAQDTLVPASTTMKLYKKFKELGHMSVHIFIVDNGAHGNILWGLDGERCKNVLHAFYKHYNLPYNIEYAQKGQFDFLRTQP